MRAPRSPVPIASLVLIVAATMVGLGSTPRAQDRLNVSTRSSGSWPVSHYLST